MKTFNCVIIDDHIPSQEILKGYIARLPMLRLESVFNNSMDALENLHSIIPQILFIDVEMPNFSGIDFLKTLKNLPSVIVTTAHSMYAKDSFDIGAIDFLHKPYPFDRFVKAVNRLIENQLPKNIVEEKEKPKFIFLKSGIQLNKVFFDEIIYIEAYGNYTKFHLKTGNVELITDSLSNIEKKLPSDSFGKIHKSYIIALKSVKVIKNKSLFVENIELPIGDIFRGGLLHLLEIENGKLY
jgi:DNA-binding LytR/AlgR family response regulator